MSISSQLRATLWKHCVIRRRHFLLTTFELLVPVLIVAFVAYVRSQVPALGKQYVNETTRTQPFDGATLLTKLSINDVNVYYAPSTEFTEDLVRRTQLKVGLHNHLVFGFRTEADLYAFYNKNGGNGTDVAIVFDDSVSQIPKNLNYHMKVYKDSALWNTKDLFVNTFVYLPGIGSEGYIDSSFLPIQYALETSYIEMVSNKSLDTTFEFEEFPYPPHTVDSGVNDLFVKCLPLLTILSFLFVCLSVLNSVIQEKASGIKELMKINGLQTWSLWTGWFLNGFVLNVISVVAMVVLLKCAFWGAEFPPIEHCDWGILFLFLVLYCSATTSFMLFFSVFFNRAILATVIAMVFWLAGFLILTSIGHRTTSYLNLKNVFALVPNVALFYGYDVISTFELREVKLSFGNAFELPSESPDDFSMGQVLLYLFLETIAYFLLTLYLDQIFPGPYGIPKTWHSIVPIRQLWQRTNSVGNMEEVEPKAVGESMEMLNNVMVHVQDLTKEYATVTAVKKLNIDIYKGTITSLLGQNGAGKTTTMSMICGMVNPTSGDILIDGISVKRYPEKARKLMSICPQHDLLFNELSVRQHLVFFGLLRGWNFKDSELLADDLLKNRLNLSSKRDELVTTLSGGMRRKLALGMSMMGKPKLLILDEPTAGVDIEGRREIWDMIRNTRSNHTILLSTHLLEEADELSDRVGIMNQGVLICYDSPLLLRNKYNMGYTCTVYKSKSNAFNIDKVKELFSDDYSTSSETVEFHFSNTMKRNLMTSLAKLTEERKKELGIDRVKLTNTTLEDVVLKATSVAQEEKQPNQTQAHQIQKQQRKTETNQENGKDNDSNDIAASTVNPSIMKKLQHLAKGHYYFLWKTKGYVITMLALFFTFAVVTLYANKMGYKKVSVDGPTLSLNLKAYGETKVYFSVNGGDDLRLANYYRGEVSLVESIPLRVDDAVEKIIRMGIENIAHYKKRMIVASEFELNGDTVESVRVLYSNNALHGAPISLNLATNTILKYLMDSDEYSVSLSNTPLHAAKKAYVGVQQSSSANMLLWFFFLPLAPLLLMSALLIYPTYMYLNEINVLQRLCGIRVSLYWIQNYVVDLMFVLVCCCFMVVIFLGQNYQVWNLFGILVLYYVVNIPFGYLFTRGKSVEMAIFRYLTVSVLLGLGFAGALLVAEAVEAEETWTNLFLAMTLSVPQATLVYLMGRFALKASEVHNWDLQSANELKFYCHGNPKPCCDPDSLECHEWRNAIAYDWSLIMAHILIGIGYFIIVICFDSGIDFDYLYESVRCWFLPSQCANSNKTRKHMLQGPTVPAPEHVRHQNEKGEMSKSQESANQGSSKDATDKPYLSSPTTPPTDPTTAIFTVRNISKKYPKLSWILCRSRWIRSVEEVSFDINRNECLGLLGVNGAGKTTTFRILTKSTLPGTGTVRSRTDSAVRMGYCPQRHALIGSYTPSELLREFANLGGGSADAGAIERLLISCGLGNYGNVPCENLSGGNKRKLNVALAIVSCPDLLVLDEPSAGVDPFSRRELWNLIRYAKSTGSVILSSHSMEECEALCDRIAVLQKGMNTEPDKIENLKKKFCVGHMVSIEFKDTKTMEEKANEVMEKLYEVFYENEENNVTEKRRSYSTLHVQIRKHSFDKIFVLMEELRRLNPDYNIVDYFVKETSFEDVFLSIANCQKEVV